MVNFVVEFNRQLSRVSTHNRISCELGPNEFLPWAAINGLSVLSDCLAQTPTLSAHPATHSYVERVQFIVLILLVNSSVRVEPVLCECSLLSDSDVWWLLFELCKWSLRELSEQLISDMAGDPVFPMSDIPPRSILPSSQPSGGGISRPWGSFKTPRRYLARAFWNHTWK